MFDYTQPIPIITVSDNGYPRPQQNADGQWVVSASAVNQQPNKVVLFNPLNLMVTPVTPYTVSIDYLTQVREYENTLAQIQAENDNKIKGLSDTTDPFEVNSLADVLTAGNEDWSMVKSLSSTIPKLFKGDFKGAAKEWWEHSDANAIVDKVVAGKEFVENTLIDPLTANTGAGAKSVKLLSNFTTNLSETIDMITMANDVKGFAQGLGNGGIDQALSNVKAAHGDVYGSGRKQFDWNLTPTGNPLADGIINVGLEILSDPTSWISFGTSGAIKGIGKEAFSTVIKKSADDVGLILTKDNADDLADVALRTFIRKPVSLEDALRTSKLKKTLNGVITPEVSAKFFDAMTTNVKAMGEYKTLNILKTVRGVTDDVQAEAMKAVALSSALGVGYGVVKAGLKSVDVGFKGLSYITAKVNNMLSKSNLDKATFKTINESMAAIEQELNTMSDLFKFTDTTKAEIIRRATKSFQDAKYNELQRIVGQSANSSKIYAQLNEWAVKEGYENIEVWLEDAIKRNDILPEDLVNTAQNIQYEINKHIRKDVAKTIQKFADELDPRKLYRYNAFEYREMIKNFKHIYSIPDITNNVSAGLLKHIQKVLTDRVLWAEVTTAQDNLERFNRFGLGGQPILFNYVPIGNPEQLNSIMQYATNTLNSKVASDFSKRNAQRILEMIRTDNHYKLLLSTGMTKENAAMLEDTLRSILKYNADEINEGHISTEDIKYLVQVVANWRKDPYAITKPILDKANQAWSNIYNYFITSVQKFDGIDAKGLELYTRNEMKHFFILSKRLSKIAELVEAIPVQQSTLQTTVSDIISKYSTDIPKSLTKALTDKGWSHKELSNLILNMSGVKLNDIIKSEDTAYSLESFTQLLETLENTADLTYFVKEGGLEELHQVWEAGELVHVTRAPKLDKQVGFSIELGNDIVNKLDELIERLKATAPSTETLSKVQEFRDEVEDLINYAYQGIETRIKTTARLVETKLYQVKLSHINALQQLLTTEGVEDFFEQVRTNQGVGDFLDALVDLDADNFSTQAVQDLQSLSKSIYTGKQFMHLISKASFSKELKDGVYDYLAGIATRPRSIIPNTDTFATEVLSGAKKFIDNKNNSHPARLHDLSKRKNVLEEAETLYRHAFMEDEATPELIKEWKPLYDAVHKDPHTFNMTYSVAQTTKTGGSIYQFAYVLPDGSSALFINKPVYEHMMKNINQATALELFGTSDTTAKKWLKDNLAELTSKNRVQFFDNDIDFATAMYNVFHQVKQTARNNDLTPRLIGYNSALDSFGTDKALSDYMYKNLLNTRILYNGAQFKSPMAFETLDGAMFMRIAHDGAIVVTDDMHKEMVQIVEQVKQYLDKANAGEPFAKAYIMPNFTRKTTAALREMLAVIDNIREIKSGNTHEAVYKYLTKTQYEVITTSFKLVQLEALRQNIVDVLKNLGDEMLSIRQTNQALGQNLLIQDALTRMLNEPNVMQILLKHLVGPEGVPALSFKLFNDPKVFNSWYSKVPEDMLTLGRMYDVAEHLQDQLDRIKHPILILSEDSTILRAITQKLHDTFKYLDGRRYSVWNESTLLLNLEGHNQLQNYIVAKQYWDSITKVAKPEKVELLAKELRAMFGEIPLLDYIFDAQHTVMLDEPLYVPHIKVLQSELVDESNKLLQKINELNAILGNTRQMKTLEDALTLDNYLRDEHGHLLPSAKVKEALTKGYGRFINIVKDALSSALIDYENAIEDADEGVRLAARRAYTKQVDSVIKVLDDIKNAHAMKRARTVLTLDASDYIKYLYKYAQGIQIIHLGADIFTKANTDMQAILKHFIQTLKEGVPLGLRYSVNPKTDEMFIYLDKNVVELTKLEEAVKEFKLPDTTLAKEIEHPIASAYFDFIDLMDKHFDGMYGMSVHRAMTAESYNDMFQYLPKNVQDIVISKDYFDEKDMLQGVFSHNILGDYGYGMGNIFSVYSNNLVTNVAAGFNTVYNHLRGKDLYKSLMFNHEYKLSTWIDQVERFTPVTYLDLNKAIQNKHMVLCKWTEAEGVVPVTIKNVAQYKEALKDQVMLLDYFSYTRAVEILNNNRINSKVLHFLNKNFLAALKVGQLLSTGWVLRNITDSTLKGWVQSGLDPAYMVSWFTKTRQIMADYEYTLSKVFNLTEAKLSDDLVTDLFRVLKEEPQLLDKGVVIHNGKFLSIDAEVFVKHPELLKNKTVHRLTEIERGVMQDELLFKKLLTFYNTSSSTPSPAQMNLYNNLAQNLYTRVKGNRAIKLSDVKDAIQIFSEHTLFTDAKQVIYSKFPENVAVDLMLLRKFMPTETIDEGWVKKAVEGFLPTRKLMEWNNDFERVVRTHTFLYHSEYTNGTVADALRLVDESQFNRRRDSKTTQLLEMLLPFSSFQVDNLMFWKNTALGGANNVVAYAEDVLNGMCNSEELDLEELSRNMSLQYLFLSGNLILNNHDGLSLKTSDSVHGTLQLLVNPFNSVAEMLNVPVKTLIETLKAIDANKDLDEYMQYMEEHNGKEPYGVTKPLKMYEGKDTWELYSQLIPLVGVLSQRYTSAFRKGKLEPTDMILPILMPSVFGVVKLDSAGTTYESRPIGTDWYNRDQAYKDTHRYVFGISYVPSWMSKDPQTYANTFQRLQDMGYSKETAAAMMQDGWYMKAPGYQLKHYTPYVKRPYTKRYYAKRPRIVKSYPTYAKLPRKQRKFSMKSNKPIRIVGDRTHIRKVYGVRRVYRPQLYSNRYTRTGVSRELMISWRGANRSSRQLLRDRSRSARIRQSQQMRQMRAIR